MKRIHELDGLRGLLAWWMVASYYLVYSGFFYVDLPPVVRLVVRMKQGRVQAAG